MPDLRELCNHLRELGSQPETPEARAEVEAAFALKWEGVQVVAARILGQWGGRRSVELLRERLEKYAQLRRRSGLGCEYKLTEALIACYELQDVPWMLDLYFNNRCKYSSSHLIPGSLPIELTYRRIAAECKHPEVSHRQRALDALYAVDFPDRCELLKQLAADRDQFIRRAAKWWLKRLCSNQ